MSGVAGRRDTPAARAALARRRQRAAQTIVGPDGRTTEDDTSNVPAVVVPPPPVVTRHPLPPPMSKPPPPTQRPRRTTLTVDTQPAGIPTSHQAQPRRSTHVSSSPFDSTHSTQGIHGHVSTVDATYMATATPTTTAPSAPTLITPSSLLSASTPTTQHPTNDVLTSSEQVADQAMSILSAVNARTMHQNPRRSSNRRPMIRKDPPPPATAPILASQVVVPPPEDLLLQSRRRRQALESKQRSSSVNDSGPMGGNAPLSTPSVSASPVRPGVQSGYPTGGTPSRSTGTSSQTQQTTIIATATTTTASSPSTTRLPLSPQQQLRRQSPTSLRQLRQLRSRTPSPNRHRQTASMISTSTVSSESLSQNQQSTHSSRQQHNEYNRQAPPPPQQQQQQQQYHHQEQTGSSPGVRRTALQTRVLQKARRPTIPQQENERSRNPFPSTPSHYEAPSYSNVLMDSSFQDASTLVDLTLHQMQEETTPKSVNTQFMSPSHPLFSESHFVDNPMSHHHHISEESWMHRTMIQQSEPLPTAIPTWEPSYSYLVDEAVLRSGSEILLRSYSYPTTVGVLPPNPDDQYRLASLGGVGLGRPQESLILQKVVTTDSQGDDDIVRHGDTVLLYSAAAENLALGSRKFVHSSTGTSKIELGFFGHGGKAELWILLPSRPDQEVSVGLVALGHKKNDYPVDTAIPLRSGDPILLRNAYNGGILSMDSNGNLILLTDSYQHDERYSEDPSLLGRLQQHNRMTPTLEDTFQMILTVTPPCPPWTAQGGSEERIFLSGSYLFQTDRNLPSIQLESELFSENIVTDSTAVLQESQRYLASDENLSPTTKERILIDEVIGSFLGLEGVHVRLQKTTKQNEDDRRRRNFEFRLVDGDDVTFDAGLRNLVDQILPLSTSFVRVRNFVSSHQPGYEYGRVMQAFCEALDALLQDYVNFVSQLEWELRKYAKADTLTMKSVYFQASPSIHSMSILEHATEAVAECKGGELINRLWALDTRSYMGDTVAKKVLGILLQKATEPYMEIMSDWLQTGALNDPCHEFMVQRCTSTGRTVFDGDSWFNMFQINENHVLHGIAPNQWTKDKILSTGKYWNAVQECHLDFNDIPRPIKNSKIPTHPFNSDSSAIAAYIDAKYRTASRVLVRVLVDNFKVMESLNIMKRYFLVDQGDFLMHFLDSAEQELLKPRDEISMGRLQHWLNMAVQMTEVHREDWVPNSGLSFPTTGCPLIPAGLRCRLSEESLVMHLDSLYGGGIADQVPVTPSRRAYGMSTAVTGIEVFTIDIPIVPFPISLLMSQKAMDDYKLLFRHLFFTKHVERRLIGVWKDNQLLKKLGALRGPLGATYLLRQKMLHLVQNLIYYMIFEVVESNWLDMRNALDERSNGNSEQPQTVDGMLEIHNSFLGRTLEACLLTNSDLIRSLTKLMKTCLLFTDQMKRFMDTTKIHDDSLSLAAEKRGAIQRNLNERGPTAGQLDKRALRQAFSATREERQMILNRQTRRVGREVYSESYQRMVQRFDEVFNQDLANFMTELNLHASSSVVANLGIRLDYNGYVSGTMAERGNQEPEGTSN